MLKRTIPVLLTLTVLLTACGPQATPTANPADVQGTAVAAAWTMVAETQAAIPTATPLPPTNTPSPTALPTFTQVALPTSTFAALPTATQASQAADPNSCLVPLDLGEAGPTVPIRIENESGGTIRVSLTMYEKNAFGQCGAVGPYDLGKNGKENISLPRGKWFAYAWVTYQNGSSGTSSGSFELRIGDNDLLRLVVGPEAINTKP
ncbi:MAG: hypothetical protein AB1649_06520 [Chloroflexota bacterium]